MGWEVAFEIRRVDISDLDPLEAQAHSDEVIF